MDRKSLQVDCELCGASVMRRNKSRHLRRRHPEVYRESTLSRLANRRMDRLDCVYCGDSITKHNERRHIKSRHPTLIDDDDMHGFELSESWPRGLPKTFKKTMHTPEYSTCIDSTDLERLPILRKLPRKNRAIAVSLGLRMSLHREYGDEEVLLRRDCRDEDLEDGDKGRSVQKHFQSKTHTLYDRVHIPRVGKMAEDELKCTIDEWIKQYPEWIVDSVISIELNISRGF